MAGSGLLLETKRHWSASSPQNCVQLRDAFPKLTVLERLPRVQRLGLVGMAAEVANESSTPFMRRRGMIPWGCR